MISFQIDIQNSKIEKAEVFHNQKLNEIMKVFEEKTSQMSLLEKTIEALNIPAKVPAQAFISYESDSSVTVESAKPKSTTPNPLKFNPEASAFVPRFPTPDQQLTPEPEPISLTPPVNPARSHESTVNVEQSQFF